MFEGATHHIGVLQQAQYQQPWGLLNSPSSSSIMMSKNMNNMITSCVDLRGSSECVDMNIGSHNNTTIIDAEDFFIGDLSDFSNEDIAAPIKNASLLLMQDGHSSFQFSSDDNSTSASISKGPPSAFNSHSTTSAHTSTSGSVLLHASPTALDNFDSSLHIEMDTSLSLPCQNEAGFEWLMSFGEDNLIYDGASNFGMDSFLLSNAEPFDGGYDGLMKHGGYEEDDSSVKGVKVGLAMNDATTNFDVQGRCGGDHFSWHNENGEVKEVDAIMFMPYSTGSRSARTKRAHSAGWSSSNILCNNWDNDSPTTSLNSTSQFMPNPPYSSPTLILPKQEEKGEQHGYIDPTQAHNVEVIGNSTLNPPNRDKPFIKASKFSSSDQPTNGCWAKEVENTRKECVSSYGGVQPRRCTHCLSQKTPQWRAGPHGPKTLCNACGVRFKSGRLFDEYRPAKSPTFLSYKHSNSHKKVMEMRRRKTFPYNHRHHHQQQAAHQARAAPRSFKHAEVDSHLGNKLKIKLNPSALEPHSHFSDVTLISTRSAIESPSSFLY